VTLRGLPKWNIVKTLGKAAAKAVTLSYIFILKVKNCPYANSVGVILRKRNLIGVISWWKVISA
jgi:hypothetical protein